MKHDPKDIAAAKEFANPLNLKWGENSGELMRVLHANEEGFLAGINHERERSSKLLEALKKYRNQSASAQTFDMAAREAIAEYEGTSDET